MIGRRQAVRAFSTAIIGFFSGCNTIIGLELGEAQSEGSPCSDVWDDNECTDEMCTEGVPSEPPTPMGALCTGGICNGQGTCITHCDTPAQCPETGDPCKEPTCVDHQCGFSEVEGALLLPDDQTTGDCQQLQCDGNGGTLPVTDDSDVHDDGNDCTLDTCANGVVQHTATPNESCAGGQGKCNDRSQCELGNGQPCSPNDHCESGHCVDGVCCNSACDIDCISCNIHGNAGTCRLVPMGSDDDNPSCSGANACNGSGVCVNAGEKGHFGDFCTGDGDCFNGACHDTELKCRLGGGDPCTTGDQCESGTCDNDNECT